jgi:dipeptidyl aminopeptidase/acylaminoacyl peptidase
MRSHICEAPPIIVKIHGSVSGLFSLFLSLYKGEAPPLLVKIHGGPTACTGSSFNPSIQAKGRTRIRQ